MLSGLITGLFVQHMANPRMGLSAHLEGVMNGMLLMITGLIWKRLMLSAKILKFTFLLLIYSSIANVLAVSIAALTGSGKMMPLSGGVEGNLAVEGLISFLLISLTLSMLTGVMMVVLGFYRYIKKSAQRGGAVKRINM